MRYINSKTLRVVDTLFLISIPQAKHILSFETFQSHTNTLSIFRLVLMIGTRPFESFYYGRHM